MQFAGLQGDGYVRDGLLIRRAVNGEVVDVGAGAYDTCQILGMDVTYAETPDDQLPDTVAEFYAAAGDEVLRLALKGWHRGREVAVRDLWPVTPKADRGNRAPRARRTIYVTRDGWNGEKVVAPTPDSVVTPESRQRAADQKRRDTKPGDRPKGPKAKPEPPDPAGYLVQTDLSKLALTPQLMAKLSRGTKAELRELLTPRQYQNRLVHQVLAALRAQSRGLSSRETLLADTIRRELRWSEPDLRLQRLL